MAGSGRMHRGAWERNMRHGEGVHTFPNGYMYTGSFWEHAWHGFGKMQYTDGTVWKGEWQRDKRCGQGVKTWPWGKEKRGQWVDGEFQDE